MQPKPFRIFLAVSLTLLLGALTPSAGAHPTWSADDHGTMTLGFEIVGEECHVAVEAHHVDVEQAVFLIAELPDGPEGPEETHIENVTGTPQEGGGFYFDLGVFAYDAEDQDEQFFVLHWGDEEHAIVETWSMRECAPDAVLRVHEGETGGARTAVEGCTVFVEGANIRSDSGTLTVSNLFVDDSVTVELTAEDMVAQEDGIGWAFFVGPFEVDDDGIYFVTFEPTNGSEDGSDASFNFFTVSGCTDTPPGCPANVTAQAADGMILVSWDLVPAALGYNVYRAEAGGEFELIDEVAQPVTIVSDTDVEAGVTYEYRVTAIGALGETEGCEAVEVTMIPFFGAPIAVALALAGSVGAFAWLRRR